MKLTSTKISRNMCAPLKNRADATVEACHNDIDSRKIKHLCQKEEHRRPAKQGIVGDLMVLQTPRLRPEILLQFSASKHKKKDIRNWGKRWFVVAEYIGTDTLMRTIPKSWKYRLDKFRLSTLTWQESCMLAFLASCRDAGQAVTPRTAVIYLSAVHKFLEDNGIDVNKFFERS